MLSGGSGSVRRTRDGARRIAGFARSSTRLAGAHRGWRGEVNAPRRGGAGAPGMRRGVACRAAGRIPAPVLGRRNAVGATDGPGKRPALGHRAERRSHRAGGAPRSCRPERGIAPTFLASAGPGSAIHDGASAGRPRWRRKPGPGSTTLLCAAPAAHRRGNHRPSARSAPVRAPRWVRSSRIVITGEALARNLGRGRTAGPRPDGRAAAGRQGRGRTARRGIGEEPGARPGIGAAWPGLGTARRRKLRRGRPTPTGQQDPAADHDVAGLRWTSPDFAGLRRTSPASRASASPTH